jgi:hypothetical protein
MEIPSGTYCDECPCCSRDSEYGVTCRLFEDPTIDKTRYDAHIDLLQEGRCSPCLSAYPNGATITITPK